MRRWLIPAVLLLASVTSGALATRSDVAPRDAEARPEALATPVLSARRTPAVLRRTIGDVRLASALDATIGDPALGAARDDSCLVVRHRGRILYERNPTKPLLPASTIKLLTAVAALGEIGAKETLVTELRATAAPVDGVVSGALYLVGGGDALLATTDYAASFQNQPQTFTPIERLADQVVAQGVRAVRGGVVGDDTRYDAQRYVPTWKPGYLTAAEVGPIGALIVNDGFAQWKPRRVAASNPAEHAAALFAELLRARGVVVDGMARAGRLADRDRSHLVSTLPSRPVGEMVGQMLRESDNTTAEVLTKELGQRAGKATWAGGTDAIRAELRELGMPIEGFVAVDGSGLDRSDRATCALVLAALEGAGTSGLVVDGLAIAGQTGTLAKRFVGHPAEGRLRAKTGSLAAVTGLSGIMTIPDDIRPLSFALIANSLPRDAVGRALQERVALVLAAYPDAPGVEELGLTPPDVAPAVRPPPAPPEPAAAP